MGGRVLSQDKISTDNILDNIDEKGTGSPPKKAAK